MKEDNNELTTDFNGNDLLEYDFEGTGNINFNNPNNNSQQTNTNSEQFQQEQFFNEIKNEAVHSPITFQPIQTQNNPNSLFNSNLQTNSPNIGQINSPIISPPFLDFSSELLQNKQVTSIEAMNILNEVYKYCNSLLALFPKLQTAIAQLYVNNVEDVYKSLILEIQNAFKRVNDAFAALEKVNSVLFLNFIEAFR